MTRYLSSIVVLAFLIIFSLAAQSARAEDAYDTTAALKSLINPHDQINDEGSVMWNKCVICHPATPDVDKARSINDVKLHFASDLKQLCFRCHPQRVHPGSEWVGRAMRGDTVIGAPNHLVVPKGKIANGIEMSLKETFTMLPLEPGSGKIFCATCHNPHERGLLKGRADTGGDDDKRFRTVGVAICQLCHRK